MELSLTYFALVFILLKVPQVMRKDGVCIKIANLQIRFWHSRHLLGGLVELFFFLLGVRAALLKPFRYGAEKVKE